MAAQESMGLSWKPDIDFNCAVCVCVPHHLCPVHLCTLETALSCCVKNLSCLGLFSSFSLSSAL